MIESPNIDCQICGATPSMGRNFTIVSGVKRPGFDSQWTEIRCEWCGAEAKRRFVPMIGEEADTHWYNTPSSVKYLPV